MNEYKVVLLGDTSIGKSSICIRYIKDTFYQFQEPTIGAAFLAKSHNDNVKFHIWDTAGQERYRTLAPMYYRDANVVLLCYDITQQSSFDNLYYWIDNLQNHSLNSVKVVLVGTKLDMHEKRVVNKNDIEKFIQNHDILFGTETSSLSGENIIETFDRIALYLEKNKEKYIPKKNIHITRVQKKQYNSSCCV